jgi:ADP-ribosyl-[dinitrogen reductase] hydrolase
VLPVERYAGCLVGTAVGDSLLLPAEGLSARRIARRWPGPLRHRLLFGRGLVSDDTEHAFLLARCLAAEPRDPAAFARRLAWRLRWWLVALPPGCGKATALGVIRLWLGWSPERAGVHSGGNGPSMRAALIGAVHADNAALRRAYVLASTSLTHRHPHALAAAQAVAATAAWLVKEGSEDELWSQLADPDPDWQRVLAVLRAWHKEGADCDALAAALGCPGHVSGWSMHSVPFALGCWLRHRGDTVAGLTSVLRAGGDTDTVGAIAGALYGVAGGESAFPAAWISGIIDRPVSVTALRAAAATLAGAPRARWAWPLLPLRNLGFLIVILVHVAGRWLRLPRPREAGETHVR